MGQTWCCLALGSGLKTHGYRRDRSRCSRLDDSRQRHVSTVAARIDLQPPGRALPRPPRRVRGWPGIMGHPGTRTENRGGHQTGTRWVGMDCLRRRSLYLEMSGLRGETPSSAARLVVGRTDRFRAGRNSKAGTVIGLETWTHLQETPVRTETLGTTWGCTREIGLEAC